jgi:hypothetical protein
MLYGAPRQSGLLAAGLRSNARQAADRDRLSATCATASPGRDPQPVAARRSLTAAVRRHVGRRSAAHAGAR